MDVTRRRIVQAAGWLAATGAAATAGRHLRIGVGTYSYHGLSMDAMIAQLVRLGVKEIEMSRGEFMLLSHPTADLFRSARAKLDRAGIRCVSYYAATIKNEGEIDEAVRFAGLLGSSHITGDAPGSLLGKVDERVSRGKLTFGIHNHYFKEKFAYESPEDILKALAGLSKSVGTTLDTGHFASCGYDPLDAVRKLGSHLKLVHLKDVKAAGGEVNVLLGRGIARIAEVMEELRKQNYQGLVAIEYEKEGPVEDDMRQQIEFARSLA